MKYTKLAFWLMLLIVIGSASHGREIRPQHLDACYSDSTEIQASGTKVGCANTLNFTGTTPSVSGGTATIAAGGGGGGGGIFDGTDAAIGGDGTATITAGVLSFAAGTDLQLAGTYTQAKGLLFLDTADSDRVKTDSWANVDPAQQRVNFEGGGTMSTVNDVPSTAFSVGTCNFTWGNTSWFGNGNSMICPPSRIRGTADSGTASTLVDAAPNTGEAGSPDDFYGTNTLVAHRLLIISGTGAGQVRTITSNTLTTLTVTPNWNTTPDATSVYRILRPGLTLAPIEAETGELLRLLNYAGDHVGGIYLDNNENPVLDLMPAGSNAPSVRIESASGDVHTDGDVCFNNTDSGDTPEFCIAEDTDRPFADLDADGTKDAGESYMNRSRFLTYGVSDASGAAVEDTGTEVCALDGGTCVDSDIMGSDGSATTCATSHANGSNFWAFCTP